MHRPRQRDATFLDAKIQLWTAMRRICLAVLLLVYTLPVRSIAGLCDGTQQNLISWPRILYAWKRKFEVHTGIMIRTHLL